VQLSKHAEIREINSRKATQNSNSDAMQMFLISTDVMDKLQRFMKPDGPIKPNM